MSSAPNSDLSGNKFFWPRMALSKYSSFYWWNNVGDRVLVTSQWLRQKSTATSVQEYSGNERQWTGANTSWSTLNIHNCTLPSDLLPLYLDLEKSQWLRRRLGICWHETLSYHQTARTVHQSFSLPRKVEATESARTSDDSTK